MHQDDKTPPVEQDRMAQPDQAQNVNQRHQESRRRLLKAAAVAPVIYTLPSGSALARGSSCINSNDGDNNNIIYGNGEKEYDEEDNLLGMYLNGEFYEYAGTDKNGNQKYAKEGQIYIYYENNLWTTSCWSSIHVTSTGSTKAFQNIV